MDEYRRIFGYKSPLTTICDPEFVDYLEDMKKSYSIELELENLLGGKVKLVSTPCINKKVWRSNAAIKQCDHAFQNVQAHARRCMKEFVDGYPSCELVVCTSSLKAREYYASVPGLIVITRDLRGGIQIYTIPSQIISETIRATKMIDPVKKVESIFFDLAVDVCDDEPQGTANKRKRKGAGGESKKPKKLQKSEFVLPDDSLRRPDLIDNQSIGASVTAILMLCRKENVQELLFNSQFLTLFIYI